MELYIYETPEGNVADFRPYLDGFDHSFADHRELQPSDPVSYTHLTLPTSDLV